MSLEPENGYLPAITAGIKLSKNLKILNLDGTNLNTQGLITVVNSLCINIESLDISHNPKIGLDGYKHLCEHVLELEKYSSF